MEKVFTGALPGPLTGISDFDTVVGTQGRRTVQFPMAGISNYVRARSGIPANARPRLTHLEHAGARLNRIQQWTRPQWSNPFDMRYSRTMTIDLNRSQDFRIPLHGPVTLRAWHVERIGQQGVLEFIQDFHGGRRVAISANWRTPDGGPLDLALCPGCVTRYLYRVWAVGIIHIMLLGKGWRPH